MELLSLSRRQSEKILLVLHHRRDDLEQSLMDLRKEHEECMDGMRKAKLEDIEESYKNFKELAENFADLIEIQEKQYSEIEELIEAVDSALKGDKE